MVIYSQERGGEMALYLQAITAWVLQLPNLMPAWGPAKDTVTLRLPGPRRVRPLSLTRPPN